MKVIGTLDTRDDGDMILEVLDHVRPLVDELYVYDDGSTDGSSGIIRNHPAVSYYAHRDWFTEGERAKTLQHRRSHLLDQVKRHFPYQKEEIWVVRIEGDRFFLNQPPREIVERALHAGHDNRCAVSLLFRRHRAEGWEDADTWPNWHDSIRNIQRWFRAEEIHNTIAFKVTGYADYRGLNRPRPWPAGLRSSDYPGNKEQGVLRAISKDMAFIEHHGRRSPKYLHWALTSGSRPISRKMPKEWDLTSPETLYHSAPYLFKPYRVLPWMGMESLDPFIKMHNDRDKVSKPEMRYFYRGMEHFFTHVLNGQLPPRKDL